MIQQVLKRDLRNSFALSRALSESRMCWEERSLAGATEPEEEVTYGPKG
jgi:hypothetical protein